MDNLSKKQKFIILTVIGVILLFGLFIWSMIINLSQFSLSNNIPKVNISDMSNNKIDNKELNETDDNLNQLEQNSDSNNQEEQNQKLDLDKILK